MRCQCGASAVFGDGDQVVVCVGYVEFFEDRGGELFTRGGKSDDGAGEDATVEHDPEGHTHVGVAAKSELIGVVQEVSKGFACGVIDEEREDIRERAKVMKEGEVLRGCQDVRGEDHEDCPRPR